MAVTIILCITFAQDLAAARHPGFTLKSQVAIRGTDHFRTHEEQNLMQTAMTAEDLGRLTRLACTVVHSIDFAEFGELRLACKHLLCEVDRLDQKYMDHSLLFDIRAAVLCKPRHKHTIYTLTRHLLRMFNDGQDHQARQYLSRAPIYATGRKAASA